MNKNVQNLVNRHRFISSIICLVFIVFLLGLFGFGGVFDFNASMEKEPTNTLVPAISATLNDSFADADMDGMAAPGETVTYTATINNTGTDATGVQFSDTLDAVATLVPGSVHASPIARNESFNAVGNTLLEVGVAASGFPAVTQAGNVLSNDTAVTDTFSVVSNTNPGNGSVTFNANGTFSYLPNANFTGPDTFTYTIRNNAAPTLTDTATVTINVANKVWYVNNSGANGNGRSNSPFNNLTSANTASGTGDIIFVHETGTNYNTGITLKNNQLLIGQGVDLVVNTFTLVTVTSNPVISPGSANGINLASGNTIRGLTVGNTGSGIGITGSSVGSLNISDTTINGTGEAVDINGGSLSVTLDSLSSSNSSNQGIDINNVSGTFEVTGGTTITNSSNTGVDLTSSGSATFTFADLDITTTNDTGLFANAGTVNSTSGIISTGSGRGVDISGATLGVALTSVSASGASNGISLSNTTGTFTINGDGSTTGGVLNRNGSGGTINGTTADSVSLTNANNVTLRQMNITSCGNGSPGDDCIDMNGGGTIVLSGVQVENATGTGANLDFGNGLRLTNVTGNNRIDNDSLFTNFPVASTHAVQMRNTGTNGNLTINDSGFTSQPASNSATYVTVQTFGTSNVNLTVENDCQFTGLRGDAILSAAESGSSGTLTTVIQNSDFLNAAANGSGAIAMTVNQNGATNNITVSNNVFRNLSTTGAAPVGIVTANVANNGGTISGTISGNTFDPNSGTRRGIQIIGQPNSSGLVGSINLTINNNDIDRIPGNFAILTDIDDQIGNSSINITNNRIGQLAGSLGQVGDTFDGAVLYRTRGTPAASNSSSISGNNIRATTSGGGRILFIDARDNRTSNLDITNNVIRNDDAGAGDPEFFARAQVGSPNLCIHYDNNDVRNNTGGVGTGTYEFRQVNGTFNVESFANVTTRNSGTLATMGTIGSSGNCVTPLHSGGNERDNMGTVNFQNQISGTLNNHKIFSSGKEIEIKKQKKTSLDSEIEIKSSQSVSLSQSVWNFAFSIGSMIVPTVYAENEFKNKSNIQNLTPVAGETVNVGAFNLPANKSVTIVFQATVADPNGANSMMTQGTVSGTNFATLMTDDPATGAANDPTITPLLLSPTAADATISGRVGSPEGRGLSRVRVVISGGNLTEPRYTQTNPFGFYRFTDLEVGETYVITVSAKDHEFTNSSRVINLNEDLADVDFVSNP